MSPEPRWIDVGIEGDTLDEPPYELNSDELKADDESFEFDVRLSNGQIQLWPERKALLTFELDKASKFLLIDGNGREIGEWDGYEVVEILRPAGGPFDLNDPNREGRSREVSLDITEEGRIKGWPPSCADHLNDGRWEHVPDPQGR